MDSTVVELIIAYRYLILFPLAAIEGPVISIIVGFLSSLGYFNPFVAFVILVLGDIVPDGAYYFFGLWGRNRSFIERYGKKFGLTPERFGVIEHLWEKHPGKTMWTSKLAYGLSTAFLISAGLAKLPLKKFYAEAVPVTLGQYAILMVVGCFFGSSYAAISTTFSGIEAVIAAVVIAGILYYALTRFMRARLLREEKEEEAEEEAEKRV